MADETFVDVMCFMKRLTSVVSKDGGCYNTTTLVAKLEAINAFGENWSSRAKYNLLIRTLEVMPLIGAGKRVQAYIEVNPRTGKLGGRRPASAKAVGEAVIFAPE